MTMLRRILTAAPVFALACGMASANSIDSVSNTVSGTGGGYTLTMNGFNTDGGLYTLTGVELYFSAIENITTFTLTSTETVTTATFNVATQTNMVLSFTNSANSADKYIGETLTTFDTGIGSALGSCSAIGGPPSAIPDDCQPIVLGHGGVYSKTAYSISNTNSADKYGLPVGTGLGGTTGVTLAGTSISDYITPTFSLTGSISTSETTSELGSGVFNANINQGGNTQFVAEVDYTYTVNNGAPEPATFVLLGGALLGLGVVRNRLKKS